MKLLAHTYFGCSRSALAILWGFAVLCPSATYAWQEEDLAHAPPAQLRLIQEPPVRIDPIVVARGALRKSLLDGDTQNATYKIAEILHGEFKSGEIIIMFSAGTLNGRLPEDAILLFTCLGRETCDYVQALGSQAWRGILPYSPEKWEELKAADEEDLRDSTPELQIPLSEAIHMVEGELISRAAPELQYRQAQWIAKYARYRAARVNFGWLIGPVSLTKRRNMYQPYLIYRVSDDRRILSTTSGSDGYVYGDMEYAPDPLSNEEYEAAYHTQETGAAP